MKTKSVDINIFGEGYSYPKDFKAKVKKDCCKFTCIGKNKYATDPFVGIGCSITFYVKKGKIKKEKLNDKLKILLKKREFEKKEFLKQIKTLKDLAIKLIKKHKN